MQTREALEGGLEEWRDAKEREGRHNGRRMQFVTITQHKVTCFLSLSLPLPCLSLNPVECHIAPPQLCSNAGSCK